VLSFPTCQIRNLIALFNIHVLLIYYYWSCLLLHCKNMEISNKINNSENTDYLWTAFNNVTTNDTVQSSDRCFILLIT